MSNLNEQIDRIKQMILFKEGMNFKDVQQLTEAAKEGVENGADVEAVGDVGASVKSAAASNGANGADVAADGGGGVEMADVVKVDISDKGEVFGDRDDLIDVRKVEAGEVMDEIPAYAITDTAGEKIGELKGGDETLSDLVSDSDVDAKGEEKEVEKAPESNFPKDEDDDYDYEDDDYDEEEVKDKEKEEPKEEPKEKTPEEEIIDKAEGEIERSEKESVYDEIIFLQQEMINYLEAEGSKDDDEYLDISGHHQQLMKDYEELSQAEDSNGEKEEEKRPGPARPAPSPDAGRDIQSASHEGLTYDIDMSLGGAARNQEMKVGKPKLSKDADGVINLKANVSKHEKYPTPATLEGYLSDDGRVFYLEYLTPDGRAYNQYKTEVMGVTKGRAAKPTVSKSAGRTKGPTGSRSSGSFSAPVAASISPFASSSSKEASKGKAQTTSKKDKDKKKKKLSERRYARRNAHYSPQSRGPKVINLKETDLYQIIERVIKEKKNSKPQALKEEDWMRDVSKEIKKDHTGGSFRRWCESKGYDSGCSDECINDALHTDNTLLHYRAGLAKAFCGADHHRNESRRPRRTLQEKKNWSEDVKTKWSPPEGTFTKSAAEIESVLKNAPGGLDKAVERLSYYINRAGKNLSVAAKRKLNGLKRKIKKDREPVDKDSK